MVRKTYNKTLISYIVFKWSNIWNYGEEIVVQPLNINDIDNDSNNIQKTISRFGTLAVNKPESSVLNFNESEFNLADDSQAKDIIETSNFTKPSDIERFTDKNEDNKQELTKRFRKIDSKKLKLQKENKSHDNFDIFTTEAKQIQNDIFQEPTNFPDLDTSDIAVDAPHHWDKDFGDKNDSFIGYQERNSFEAENNNDLFDFKEASCSPIEFKYLSTPQVPKSKWRFLFSDEDQINLHLNKHQKQQQNTKIREIEVKNTAKEKASWTECQKQIKIDQNGNSNGNMVKINQEIKINRIVQSSQNKLM